jgi:hypothetical protein
MSTYFILAMVSSALRRPSLDERSIFSGSLFDAIVDSSHLDSLTEAARSANASAAGLKSAEMGVIRT